MTHKVTIEVDMEQLHWIINHARNSISHMEKYGATIPTRRERLERFRAWLTKLEQQEVDECSIK